MSTKTNQEVADPRQLLYHYPHISAQRYAQLMSKWHHDRMAQLAGELARMFDRLIVPSSCLHWKKREEFADRKFKIGKNTYLMLQREEMTDRAYQNYQKWLESETDDTASCAV